MTFRNLNALEDNGLLPDRPAALEDVAAKYAIALTPDLASLIDQSMPHDPIAAQFIPSAEELHTDPRETADPIGDHAHEAVPGVIHRYPDRVLLKIVAVCPVYCRFCFRREMVGPGKEKNLTSSQIDVALDYIRQDTNIWEVILTGGDPFMLSAPRAQAITAALEEIEHIKVIRWHTRMPVADPDKITAEYAQALASPSKAVYVAVHTNHPKELTDKAKAALRRMHDAGLILLGQSVMLRGVNDDIETLSALMQGLVASGVKPYYLHQMDFAPGTSHFRVPLAEAQALVQELRDNVSGLCQPQFVIDIPGGVSKAVATPADISADGHQVRGRDGIWRNYGAGEDGTNVGHGSDNEQG